MGRILSAVRRWFEQQSWQYHLDGREGVVLTEVRTEHAQWRLLARVLEEPELLGIYVVPHLVVPPGRRAPVGELLHRINAGLVVGGFELDYDDGEVRFRCGVDVEGTRELGALVRQAVMAALSTSDRFFPAISGVAVAGLAPNEALEQLDELVESLEGVGDEAATDDAGDKRNGNGGGTPSSVQ
jgi:hypothetical protein